MRRSNTPSPRFLIAFLWLLLCSARAKAEPANDPNPTYRSTVSEVRLIFFTTDQQNHNVDTLKSHDFAVVDNEHVVHNFRSFNRLDEGDLQVVVMVDSSESVTPRFRQEVGEIVRLLNRTEWLPQDKVSLIAFGGKQPRIVCAGDCQTSTAAGQLFATPANGLTPLFDSLAFAGGYLGERSSPLSRPVVILFSDGEDTVSRNGMNSAVQAVLARDAQIYAIDTGKSRWSGGAITMQRLASATGGRYFSIQDGSATILAGILQDLHAAYVVTYQLPSHAAGLHEVRILPTANINLQFRCRQAYYYGDNLR